MAIQNTVEILHVKNFGPIADVKIDIKDINILLGTSSSGTHIVAKLISIFKSGQLIYYLEFGECSRSEVYMAHFNKLLLWYNIEFPIEENTYIKYQCGSLYYEIRYGFIDTNYGLANTDQNSDPVYIPSERGFVAAFLQSASGFITNEINLLGYLRDFCVKFGKSRATLERFEIGFLNVHYLFEDGNDLVEFDKGSVIKLSQTSSGMQSIISLMLVVQHNTDIDKKGDDLFVIEEPELNLYPSTQKDLAELIIGRINPIWRQTCYHYA